MKYLFISFTVRQSEYEHNHRVLFTTKEDAPLQEIADNYIGFYWDDEAEKNADGRWELFGGEMLAWLDSYVELTLDEYNAMRLIYSGVKPKETRVYVLNADFLNASGELSCSAYDIEEWKGYEKMGEALPEAAQTFIHLAEREGTVYSLEVFENALNLEELSLENNWVFITKAY